jgi:hypothetical protein
MKYRVLFLLAMAVSGGWAQAFTWNETVSGDISSNPLAPTPFALDVGVNSVSGTMGRDLPSDPIDRDIFTFTLAPGQFLTSINVVVFQPTNQSFYAIAPGTSIDIEDPSHHLSNTLVKGEGEILDDLAAGAYSGGTGLAAPLGAGIYTVWFQELSSVVTYQIDYTVQAIPEPATAAWGLCAMAVAGLRRGRVRHS